jgi:hypothetical protein
MGGMEGEWGVWRGYGGGMEGVWRGCGRGVEGVWRGCGGGVEGVWRGCGRDGWMDECREACIDSPVPNGARLPAVDSSSVTPCKPPSNPIFSPAPTPPCTMRRASVCAVATRFSSRLWCCSRAWDSASASAIRPSITSSSTLLILVRAESEGCFRRHAPVPVCTPSYHSP